PPPGRRRSSSGSAGAWKRWRKAWPSGACSSWTIGCGRAPASCGSTCAPGRLPHPPDVGDPMMPTTLVRWIAALVIVTLIIASGVLVSVREGQGAVVPRFGAPRAVGREAGLHARWPWPVESVWTIDARQRLFNSRFAETLTRDKKNIVLRTFLVCA